MEQELEIGLSSLQRSQSPGPPIPMMTPGWLWIWRHWGAIIYFLRKEHRFESLIQEGDILEDGDSKVIEDVQNVMHVGHGLSSHNKGSWNSGVESTTKSKSRCFFQWTQLSPGILKDNFQWYTVPGTATTWYVGLLEECDKLKPFSDHKVCPGIHFQINIHHVSTLGIWGQSFERSDSHTCELFCKWRRFWLNKENCCTSCRALPIKINNNTQRSSQCYTIKGIWTTSALFIYETLEFVPLVSLSSHPIAYLPPPNQDKVQMSPQGDE